MRAGQQACLADESPAVLQAAYATSCCMLPASQQPVEYYISFRLWFTEHTISDPPVNIVSSQACKSTQLIFTGYGLSHVAVSRAVPARRS